ncbi:MAG TPA: hypothetical protein VK358_03205 [Longimicrobium sp.]|nr:hypothetical protein [Longimicrobium sp.]
MPAAVEPVLAVADRPPWPVMPRWGSVEVAREAAGAFMVQVEKDTTSSPAMHVPSGWTKVHLSFTTPDSGMSVALTDNGAALVVRTQTSTDCSSVSFYHQYRERGGHRHLYQAMADAVGSILETCPRKTEAWGRYRRQFERTEVDFSAAMQAMMTHVSASFPRKGLRRCGNPADAEDHAAWQVLAELCHF